MDSEQEFLNTLIELQYGQDVVGRLIELSSSVSWAKGFPRDDVAFWNAEAFMWSRKIEKEVRELIEKELEVLSGTNLDVGCGSFSYVRSVGFDVSSKMLEFNTNLSQRVVGSVEEELPFSGSSFDSVTAVFVLNYVSNYELLFRQVRRVLKDDGKFVMVLSVNPVKKWQRQKEKSSLSVEEWSAVLGKFFDVKVVEKEGLVFWWCG